MMFSTLILAVPHQTKAKTKPRNTDKNDIALKYSTFCTLKGII